LIRNEFEFASILNDRKGVWRCRIFNCTEACPREIRITKAIDEVKKAILKGSRDIPVGQAAAAHGCVGGCAIHDRPRGDDAAGAGLSIGY
jgi:heterodisulfide reductase subunit C